MIYGRVIKLLGTLGGSDYDCRLKERVRDHIKVDLIANDINEDDMISDFLTSIKESLPNHSV